jgi:hypothetical protein
MVLLTKEMPSADFDLVLCGDTHHGTRMRSVSGVQMLLDRISKKNTYFVFMGDATESITNNDKRYDPDTVDGSTPLQQADEVIEQFRHVKRKGVAWLVGNHEGTIRGVGNLARDKICKELGIPYGTYSCRIAFNKGGSNLFSGFFHHGNGQITSTHPDPMVRNAIMTYKLKQKLEPFGGDCLLNAMGHTHKLLVYHPVDELYMRSTTGAITADYTENSYNANSYIPPYLRWYVNTGGFLKLYSKQNALSGYAERMMLQPVELGFVVVKIRDGNIKTTEKVLV